MINFYVKTFEKNFGLRTCPLLTKFVYVSHMCCTMFAKKSYIQAKLPILALWDPAFLTQPAKCA